MCERWNQGSAVANRLKPVAFALGTDTGDLGAGDEEAWQQRGRKGQVPDELGACHECRAPAPARQARRYYSSCFTLGSLIQFFLRVSVTTAPEEHGWTRSCDAVPLKHLIRFVVHTFRSIPPARFPHVLVSVASERVCGERCG